MAPSWENAAVSRLWPRAVSNRRSPVAESQTCSPPMGQKNFNSPRAVQLECAGNLSGWQRPYPHSAIFARCCGSFAISSYGKISARAGVAMLISLCAWARPVRLSCRRDQVRSMELAFSLISRALPRHRNQRGRGRGGNDCQRAQCHDFRSISRRSKRGESIMSPLFAEGTSFSYGLQLSVFRALIWRPYEAHSWKTFRT